jgi:hypothetical protein
MHASRRYRDMDALRGAPDETMAERLRVARAIAQKPKVKAIVFQTVIASRWLAERIEALLAWVEAEPLPKPLFVGIAARPRRDPQAEHRSRGGETCRRRHRGFHRSDCLGARSSGCGGDGNRPYGMTE